VSAGGLLRAPRLQWRGLVGTGGIGTGTFLRLEGNETLGREESRACRLLDRRDYCKLHIISHHVKRLLGPAFAVVPVGRVGEDEPGRRLLAQMRATGLDLRHVAVDPSRPTLNSFCLIYPDGSGGNLTMLDSASGAVAAVDVQQAERRIAALGTSGMALAAPEVPMTARAALLKAADRHGLFRVASFTRGEAETCRCLPDQCDLAAFNLEEARAAAGIAAGGAETTLRTLAARHPNVRFTVTDGARGSWSWDGSVPSFEPAVPVAAVAAAGAGDAHLAGVIAGLAAGLGMTAAHQLGVIVAAASVTSPHTIHPGLDRGLLAQTMRTGGDRWLPELRAMLE
jgi:ribokinase